MKLLSSTLLTSVHTLAVNILPCRVTVAATGANWNPQQQQHSVILVNGTKDGLTFNCDGDTVLNYVTKDNCPYPIYPTTTTDNKNFQQFLKYNTNQKGFSSSQLKTEFDQQCSSSNNNAIHLTTAATRTGPSTIETTDRRLEVVQRALDFILDTIEDHRQVDNHWAILLLLRKLSDVRDYLLSEEIDEFSIAAQLKHEFDQRIQELSTKIDSVTTETLTSNHDPMGFDLFNKIRQWLQLGGRSQQPKDQQSNQTVGNDVEHKRKRSYQLSSNEDSAERLIKYRRVDNTFPKFMPNDADDYSHMAESRQRNDQDNNSNSLACQSLKRLSMFNAPQTRRARVRNTQTTTIDLSDSEEQQQHNESNIYQAFSDRLVVDVPTMPRSEFGRTSSATRPNLLYSDALRCGTNGFASDLHFSSPSNSLSSSEARLNGHASNMYESSVSRDNVLVLEDERNEHNQYINLINNMTLHDSVCPTLPRRPPGLVRDANEKPPTPPRLQRINSNEDDWYRGVMKSKAERRPSYTLDRSEYFKLLESKTKHQYAPQPMPALGGIKKTPEISYSGIESVKTMPKKDSDKSTLSKPQSELQSETVVNNSLVQSLASTVISRPLTKALQQRHRSCIYYSDNFQKNLTEKTVRKHQQAINEKQQLIQEANKATEERSAYEQNVLEALSKRRFIGKTIFVLEKFPSAEEEEPKIIPFTDEHQQRYNELVYGPSQMLLVSKFSLNITRSDISTLTGSCWLNDEIINFYMNLLTDRSEIKKGKLPSVYAMNTFFIPRLLQNGHSAVKRWTRKVDLFSKDIIPVPVHVGGVHWCMAIIHMRNKTIRYYDSMGKPNQMVLNALEAYLREESLDKRKVPFDTSDFKIESVQNVPQQTNGSDCGVFSCMFAEYITRDQPLSFSQENMEYFRKKMVLEICGGALWN
ncbi:uncharacterized protein LOC133847641 [Drosophila sulfurigaster albostrigata]|uniref:uncharacterized protein LOC133847641 n=1 Tax=Drosophila sulfurigaster albostrigata TaxID=89887 RepID=UPI002D2188CC|nr:uncharacterized protein LOC133847641 [Drosophila sulfurigaster albostrigata]